jgi:hypothetical protein
MYIISKTQAEAIGLRAGLRIRDFLQFIDLALEPPLTTPPRKAESDIMLLPFA